MLTTDIRNYRKKLVNVSTIPGDKFAGDENAESGILKLLVPSQDNPSGFAHWPGGFWIPLSQVVTLQDSMQFRFIQPGSLVQSPFPAHFAQSG